MDKVSFSVIDDNHAFKVLQTKSNKGSKMNRHYSDQDAFFVLQSGEVSFNLNGEEIKMLKSDYIKIPALHLHSFVVSEDCEAILVLNKNAKIQFVQEDD